MDGSTNIDEKVVALEIPSEAVEVPVQPAKKARKAKRTRKTKSAKTARKASTIGFPYQDLETGISVCRAILGAGGVPLTRDQLAGAMKLAAGSGNFVLRISTARQFGLIENKDGKYQLTDLAFSIVDNDEKRVRTAKAEAFLTVDLYRRIYDEFRGRQLPSRPHGLEQSFVQFGIAPKQKDKARHAFERSAKQAGFFTHGEDRLVEPVISSGPTPSTPMGEQRRPEQTFAARRAESDAPQQSTTYHPFIQGLLETLPHPNDVWSMEGREKWLSAASNIFDLIYKTESHESAEPTKDDGVE